MKHVKNRAQIREIIMRVVFVVMLLLTAAYFWTGEHVLPSERERGEQFCEVFEAAWERILPDGSREAIAVPGEYTTDADGRMRIETTLPEMGSHTYLMFWSQRQDVNIYVGGELRKSYSTEDSRLFGKSSPALYLFIKIYPEDTGKKLEIVTQGVPEYVGAGILRTIYYGERSDIWAQILRDNIQEVVVAFLVLIFGIASVILGVVLRLNYKRRSRLEYLGWGVIVASWWIITNSSLRQILFENMSVANDLAFMAVLIMPLPFLMYLNFMQKERYDFWYGIIESLVVLDFVVSVLFQVTGISDFPSSFTWIAAVCVLAIGFIVVTMIADVVTGHIKEYMFSAVGFVGIGVSAVAQIYIYLKEVQTPFSGSLIAIGLLFLLIVSLIETIRDIIHSEEEKRQVMLASEAKARFLANMSHEIRTPINAILGMDEIILEEAKEESVLAYARDIRSAGNSLLSIVNDILDFTKIESGKMEIIPTEYELTSLLNDTYHLVAMRAKDKGLKLQFHCSETLPRRLLGDEVRVRQILLNLLTNAIKYTPEGSVTLKVDWKTRGPERIVLEVSVTDTGVGIKEENIGKLFDSFERIDEKQNRSIEGSGLGLNITKNLVELMEGTIKVKSVFGKGSTFTVTFAQEIVMPDAIGWQVIGEGSSKAKDASEASSAKQQATDEAKLEFEAPEGRILVVDDVPMNLKVIIGLLRATKLQIDTAGSGKECLKKVKSNQYHMIFLDHMMPEMDGIETLRQMKKLHDNKNRMTPVIMLTANAIVGAKEEYLAEGFDGYLSKPVDSRKLKEMIKNYLPKELLSVAGKEEEIVLEGKTFMERASFLNTSNALIYSGGSEELYEEIVRMFVEDDKQALLGELFGKEDWKNYQIQVHALKGTARSIGADEFSELAKDVEQAAKNGDVAFVKVAHSKLLEEYHKLMERLKVLIKP